MVASDTDPVREVITDGDNGLLSDIHEKAEIVENNCRCLDSPEKFDEIKSKARQTMILRYSYSSIFLSGEKELRRK